MAALIALSDAELFALVKHGDHTAFTELYERYSSLLYAYAYKLSADSDLSRDLLQDIFISFWDNREATEISGSVAGYLYSAVRFRFLKHVSHQKVKSAYAEEFLAGFEAFEDQHALAATEAELVAKVETLLAGLPPKLSKILRMSRLQHRDDAEIAKEMGLSEKTIKNLKTQAIRNLRLKIGLLYVLAILAGR